MQTMVCHCVAWTATCLMGPAILVTIGIMGLLDEFTRVRWGESWPLILIVIGVLKFLQITGSREGHVGPGGVPPAGPPPDASSTSPQQNVASQGYRPHPHPASTGAQPYSSSHPALDW